MKIFEIVLINFEINLILIVLLQSTDTRTFSIINKKLYLLVVTLSTQDNTKLLQLKSLFKGTINWKNNKSRVSTQTQNQCYLIDPNLLEGGTTFISQFANNTVRTSYINKQQAKYFLLSLKTKHCIFMINC